MALRTTPHPNEDAESCHQLLRKERHWRGVWPKTEGGSGSLNNKVPSSPSQLPLQGRLGEPGEKMSAGEIASAEQVRGRCSDLWILLSQFSESLCYKGK